MECANYKSSAISNCSSNKIALFLFLDGGGGDRRLGQMIPAVGNRHILLFSVVDFAVFKPLKGWKREFNESSLPLLFMSNESAIVSSDRHVTAVPAELCFIRGKHCIAGSTYPAILF